MNVTKCLEMRLAFASLSIVVYDAASVDFSVTPPAARWTDVFKVSLTLLSQIEL